MAARRSAVKQEDLFEPQRAVYQEHKIEYSLPIYAKPPPVLEDPYCNQRRGSLVLAAVALSELPFFSGSEPSHVQTEQAPLQSSPYLAETCSFPPAYTHNYFGYPSYFPTQEEVPVTCSVSTNNERVDETRWDPNYEDADAGYDSPDATELDPEFEAPVRARSAKTSTKSRGSASGTKRSRSRTSRSPSFEDSDSPSGGKKRKRHCDRWTEDEKQRLVEAVELFGMSRWKQIAEFVKTKDSDQCNQHWYRVLNPKIKRDAWSPEEDEVLEENVRVFGESSWKKVSECLSTGRTDTQCRHRWIVLSRSGKAKTKGKFSR